MKTTITTAGVAPENRKRHWHDAIATAYFPLDLQFRDATQFSGDLSIWDLGDVSVSRLTSDALEYRRADKHLKGEKDEQFLVTVPAHADVYFSQCGKEVQCHPGGFILERSHEPYLFSHDQPTDLFVVKVGAAALANRIRQPDRFCSLQFNAMTGAGSLFSGMLNLIPGRFDSMSPDVRSALGRQLVELLVLALKDDERTLTSGHSSVREAHLTRIETFVRRNLADAELDPDTIARACGISVRYLHELFRDTNHTLGSWLRDQRLMAARDSLADPSCRQTIAEIAYRWGFGDQAQFSRAFRSHFGQSPKEFRDAARRAVPSLS